MTERVALRVVGVLQVQEKTKNVVKTTILDSLKPLRADLAMGDENWNPVSGNAPVETAEVKGIVDQEGNPM